MDGIIVIDKPEGFTSFDVVAKLRGILKTRKLGHAGTLDPMATGVLPVLIGQATKACDILPVTDKRYTARFKLGMTTDTQDITGTVTVERPVNVTRGEAEEAIGRFVGTIEQLPPMFSAVWKDGVRLYDLARRGIEVERETRSVTFHSINLIDFDEQNSVCEIDVVCSKGAYIRTLCHDIGETLGPGATLTSLIRTEAAGFTLEDALTFEQVKAHMTAGTIGGVIMPTEAIFNMYEKVTLSETDTVKHTNGQKVKNTFPGLFQGQIVRVFGCDGQFLSLSVLDEDGFLKVFKQFVKRDTGG